ASKTEENKELLAFGLESILKIAHPFAPFVTETIWQALEWRPKQLLAREQWPEIPSPDSSRAKAFEEVKTVVAEARAVMKAVGVGSTTLVYDKAPVVEANAELIKRLARLQNVSYGKHEGGVRLVQTKYDLRLDIDQETARNYADKLAERQKAEKATIKNLEARLSNKSYVENAPEAVVNQTRAQLDAAKERLSTMAQEILRFS
ncbi:MAG TPA: class I tRNA ligase family protein, partial [Nitrososphaera sp.]|nr:class I tRNA ligase family protein [Nitrososphaera sp.]